MKVHSPLVSVAYGDIGTEVLMDGVDSGVSC